MTSSHGVFALLVASMAVLTACASSPPRLDRSSPEAYTASTRQLASELAPAERFEVGGPLTLRVAAPDPSMDPHEIHLDTPWAFCREEPDDCDAATERWLRQALDRVQRLRAEGPG